MTAEPMVLSEHHTPSAAAPFPQAWRPRGRAHGRRLTSHQRREITLLQAIPSTGRTNEPEAALVGQALAEFTRVEIQARGPAEPRELVEERGGHGRHGPGQDATKAA